MLKQIKDTLTNKNFYLTIVGFGVAVILIALLFNSVIMPWYTNHAEGLTVPDVTRMPLEKAKATLTAYGLRYEVADYRKNAVYPAGFVTDQQPTPGELVKPDRKIYLTVNRKYHPTVEVPSVVNQSLRSAKINLQNSGLKIGTISYESSRFKNSVLRQSIEAGVEVAKGTAIDLAVGNGLGKKMIDLPSLVGMGLTAAKRSLRRKGLRVGHVTYKVRPGVSPGVVISYRPKKKRVKIGTTVKLIVSKQATKQLLPKKTKTDNNHE